MDGLKFIITLLKKFIRLVLIITKQILRVLQTKSSVLQLTFFITLPVSHHFQH